ncbi:UNVERIFIED_CONTAM: hypothetical protein Sradi_7067100 [Sesamum radiatum]|uniref:Uncharacterized protein n=1 Tax=Sesamum radiatum TaxID=300843 RepID=A0AAW2J6L1_SESRA
MPQQIPGAVVPLLPLYQTHSQKLSYSIPSDSASDESISVEAASYRCLPSGTANSDGPLQETQNAWSTYAGNEKTKPSVPQCTLPQPINHNGLTGKAQGESPASWGRHSSNS